MLDAFKFKLKKAADLGAFDLKKGVIKKLAATIQQAATITQCMGTGKS